MPVTEDTDNELKTREEALEEALEFFDGDRLATDTFLKKYAVQVPKSEGKDGKTYLEATPADMWDRLAKKAASVEENEEKWEKEFREILDDFTAVPQGSIMYALGNEYYSSSCSNCFVIPTNDSLEAIFDTAKEMAKTYSYRGGVGTDISALRPRNAETHNAAKKSTGAVSFMDFYSHVTGLIGQKCIEENQRVETENGYKKIKNIKPFEDRVWTKQGFIEVHDKVNTGEKMVYEVTDSYGYSSKVTKDHKFQVITDEGEIIEKKLKNIDRENEFISILPGESNSKNSYVDLEKPAYPRKGKNNSAQLNEDINFPNHLNEDFSYFLGFYYGNGHNLGTQDSDISNGVSLSISNDWNKVKKKIRSIVSNQFNYEVFEESGDGDYENYKINSSLFSWYMSENNLEKEKSTDITVPSKIWNSPDSVKNSFIAGFFDADGSVSNGKKDVKIKSTSDSFINDIQLILLNQGVVTKNHEFRKDHDDWNKINELTIRGAYSLNKFKELIVHSIKVQKIDFKMKRDSVLTAYRGDSQEYPISPSNYVGYHDQFLSTSAYSDMKTKDKQDNLPKILVKSKIKSVEKVGKRQTYDLELPREHFFSCEGQYISNSRRGALMLTISDAHPDLYHPEGDMDFINIKRDLDKVNNANISIRISDDFMEAVENDEEWTLSWERKDNEIYVGGKYLKDSEGPDMRYERSYPAQEIWDNIIESATESAEPGLLFWDQIREESPADQYEDESFRTKSTNPCCFSKQDKIQVLTKNGIKNIKDIKSGDKIWVDTEEDWFTSSGYFEQGEAEVYRVEFMNGQVFHLTENHKLEKYSKPYSRKIKKELVKLEELKEGDRISVNSNKPNDMNFGDKGTYKEGLLMGWLTGDGTISYNESKDTMPTMYLDFWKDAHSLSEKFCSILNELGYNCSVQEFENNGNTVKRLQSRRFLQDFMKKYETNIWKFKKGSCPFLYNASKEFLKGFVSSYFSADATAQCYPDGSKYNVSISYVSRDRLEQLVNILSGFGIKSSIGLLREAKENVNFNDDSVKNYNTKACYRLTITGRPNIKNFHDNFGFLINSKKEVVDNIIENSHPDKSTTCSTTKIKSIEKAGVHEVGCIEVEEEHRFTANGIISGNSEIPLGDYGACTLLSINLTNFVENPFTEDAEVDWDYLREVAEKSVRLLDNVKTIDAEKVPLEEQKETALKGRRIGIGTHGLGDFLVKMGYEYDSEEAQEFCEKVYEKLRNFVYGGSIELAREKEPFPIFDKDKHMQSPFIQRLPYVHKEGIKRHGLRNIACLTMAPTGSVSLISQTSSGIEPIYRLNYTRRFRQEDGIEEYEVNHPLVDEYLDEMDIELDDDKSVKEQLPDEFLEVTDLDYISRTELQGSIQEYIDHAISSCVTKDSAIYTDHGLIYPDEVIDNSEKGFQSLDESYSSVNENNEKAELKEGYFNGESNNIRLKLGNGFEQGGTKDHQVKILNDDYELEWKQLNEVNEGDYIVSRIGLNMWQERLCDYSLSDLVGTEFTFDLNENRSKIVDIPDTMDKNLARLMGYIESDGWVNENGFGLTQKDNSISQDFVELCNEIFDVEVVKQNDKRTEGLYNWVVNSRILRDFFQCLGIGESRVPMVIRKSNQTCVKEFIKGLTLDGYVSDNGVCVMTDNRKEFINGLGQLLINFGINPVILEDENKDKEFKSPTNGKIYEPGSSYSIVVTKKEAHKYVSKIGFAQNYKKNESEKFKKGYGSRHLPGTIPDFNLRESIHGQDCVDSLEYSRYVNSFSKPNRFGRSIKRNNLKKLDDLGYDIPEILLDDTYIFWEVKDIEKEVGNTYDFSVPKGHSYLSNGIINHNTINLPNEGEETKQIVADSYMKAWKEGCKGYTVYVDGSRENSPLSSGEEEPTEITEKMKYKTDAKIWEFVEEDKGLKFYLTEGNDQIFINGYSVNGDQPEVIDLGDDLEKLLKDEYSDQDRIDKYVDRSADPIEKVGRLTSLALKTGLGEEVFYLFSQYQEKLELAKELYKVFKHKKVENTERCPECESDNLRHETSCVTCIDCGWSKCST